MTNGKYIMINGEKKYMEKMTWKEFQEWQRWDEYPDRSDDPPMTVDFRIFYERNEYYIVYDYGQYHIYTRDWKEIYSHENLLKLLTTPIDFFHGKSFENIIDELYID